MSMHAVSRPVSRSMQEKPSSSPSFFEPGLLQHLQICLAFGLSDDKDDKEDEDTPAEAEDDHKPADETEAERDEILRESFPASDPPPPPTSL